LVLISRASPSFALAVPVSRYPLVMLPALVFNPKLVVAPAILQLTKTKRARQVLRAPGER
jgi:hypothetical protein